jgi:Tfp pilus assembly protein FimT
MELLLIYLAILTVVAVIAFGYLRLSWDVELLVTKTHQLHKRLGEAQDRAYKLEERVRAISTRLGYPPEL